MIQVAAFDDTLWRQKIADYKQSVIRQRPTLETPQAIAHTPYPYQRLIHTTSKRVSAKAPLTRYLLPVRPMVTMESDNIYWGIHQIVDGMRQHRKQIAKAWSHKWLDPFSYLDERDTPYNDEGGIDIHMALAVFEQLYRYTPNYRVELEGISNLYNRALHANAKVIHLDSQMAEKPNNIIQIPTMALSKHLRTCAVCGNKTSSGVRPLCDGCNQRFIVDKNYQNTRLTPEDVARYILFADNRHRAQVMEVLKIAS